MAQRLAFTLVVTGALVSGCATITAVDSNVSSYGTWPAGRKPGTYCFERLPSQQARAEQQAQLELAVRGPLEMAGFTPAPAEGSCDVTVQLGARVTRYDSSPWVDPFWWRGPYYGPYYGRYGGWYGGGYPFAYYPYPYYAPVYDREVAVLIRDRASGAPLYETRASSDSSYSGGTAVLSAMFEAALKDFPTPAISPRRVTVPLPDKS